MRFCMFSYYSVWWVCCCFWPNNVVFLATTGRLSWLQFSMCSYEVAWKIKPNQQFVAPLSSYVLEDEAEWLLKEKAPTTDLRLNYFAVANAGSLSVKTSQNFKFLGQKISCSTYNTRHQISLILRMLSSEL